jgi:uncharacterized membrane protein
MKTLSKPAFILGLLYLCFFSYLAFSVSSLPGCVATHFDGSGQPNGWMNRSTYLFFMAVFGLAFPLFLVGIFSVGRFLPDRYYSIPRHDYWLAPERRAETFSYLLRHSLWFACICVCFVIGIHFSVVRANSLALAHLSAPVILGLLGCFLASILVWVVGMFRHFSHSK